MIFLYLANILQCSLFASLTCLIADVPAADLVIMVSPAPAPAGLLPLLKGLEGLNLTSSDLAASAPTRSGALAPVASLLAASPDLSAASPDLSATAPNAASESPLPAAASPDVAVEAPNSSPLAGEPSGSGTAADSLKFRSSCSHLFRCLLPWFVDSFKDELQLGCHALSFTSQKRRRMCS